MEIKIEPTWKRELKDECAKPYFAALASFVRGEYLRTSIFPPPQYIFRAFELCPFTEVKVIVLGQDPYHDVGQAHGLCFSVPTEVPIPPSLKNIYAEIKNDTGVAPPPHGNLERWARQGVLLLNATLTVRAHQAGSHQGKGWEQFTDAVIQTLSREKEHLVFILWGNYARKKSVLIDRSKHLILESAHPSPLSAYAGFFGCKHFSKTNAYLEAHGKRPIVWA